MKKTIAGFVIVFLIMACSSDDNVDVSFDANVFPSGDFTEFSPEINRSMIIAESNSSFDLRLVNDLFAGPTVFNVVRIEGNTIFLILIDEEEGISQEVSLFYNRTSANSFEIGNLGLGGDSTPEDRILYIRQ